MNIFFVSLRASFLFPFYSDSNFCKYLIICFPSLCCFFFPVDDIFFCMRAHLCRRNTKFEYIIQNTTRIQSHRAIKVTMLITLSHRNDAGVDN